MEPIQTALQVCSGKVGSLDQLCFLNSKTTRDRLRRFDVTKIKVDLADQLCLNLFELIFNIT